MIPLALLALSGAPTLDLKPIRINALRSGIGVAQIPLTLSPVRPAAIKKAPEFKAPLYTTLTLGVGKDRRSFFVVVDEPANDPSTLYVDANGNGDLTDDPAPRWMHGSYTYVGETAKWDSPAGMATVEAVFAGESAPISLRFDRRDPKDPRSEKAKDVLNYGPDYALVGSATFGAKTYPIAIADRNGSLDFRGKAGDKAGVMLLIDRTGDGRFSDAGERFDLRQPFNVDGTTYELVAGNPDGRGFKIVPSKKTVDEVLVRNLANGQPVLTFDATTMDGKKVAFPTTYKGKLVMLDFWATWCGPCMGEVPGLSKAYAEFHDQGFEILGISLDKEKMADHVREITRSKGMPWEQVYEGKYWEVPLVQKFNVRGIPAAFLVDGDTGTILAQGNELRGEKLRPTLEKLLAAKKGAVR